MKSARVRGHAVGIIAILVTAVVFIVPFAFIFVTALKTQQESSLLDFSWPTQFVFFENMREVLRTRNGVVIRAFVNSTLVTVSAVTVMVVLGAMVGWVLQRRQSRWNGFINFLVLAGLITPPAVVPTIFVLQQLGLFRTLHGLALIEVAFGLSFTVLLFRAFAATIPRDLDEAALLDGAGPLRLFFQVAFPMLRGVIVTVVVVQSVIVFNDFANPLYFAPGEENVTVQLTLYNFQSQFLTSWNLLFTNILLITIPPLVMFVFFNRQIVAGLTSGAVKG